MGPIVFGEQRNYKASTLNRGPLMKFTIALLFALTSSYTFAGNKNLTSFFHMNTDLGPVFYAKEGNQRIELKNESNLYSPEYDDAIVLDNFSVIEGSTGRQFAAAKERGSFPCAECLYVKYGAEKAKWLPIAIKNKKTMKIAEGRTYYLLNGYDLIAGDLVDLYQLENEPEYGVIKIK